MQSRDDSSTGPRIALAQVEETLAGGPERAQVLRAAGIGGLTDIKRVTLIQSRRERARMAERHGEGSPQVAALERKMALEHRFLVASRTERDRLAAPLPTRDPKVWQVHGYVRNRDGFPRAGYTVGVFADKEGRTPALVGTVTDSLGYFLLRLAPQTGLGAKPGSADTAVAPPNRLRAAVQPLYLGAQGASGSAPIMDPRPLYPNAGAIAYRDLTIDDPADGGEQCHFATRLLGNSATRELHTLDNEQTGCRLASIRPDHRVYFLSEQQAQQVGYDFCAYCFGRERSRR
jgi:hypothetical protein